MKKFQQTVGGRKDLRLDTSKRVRGRVLLYSHHISPKAEQRSAKKPSQLIISSTEKSQCLNDFLTSLAVQNTAKESHPTQNTEVSCITGEAGAGKTQPVLSWILLTTLQTYQDAHQ